MNKHTKGPWRVVRALVENEAEYRYMIQQKGWGAPNIARVYSAANAPIIAAAPALLDALTRLVAAMPTIGNSIAVDKALFNAVNVLNQLQIESEE